MASEFVEGQIKSMGVAGAIISVLMGVIVILSGAILVMYRHANKVYGYRLAERDTLKDALNDSKNALKEMLDATKDRNEITEELAELIAKQSIAFTSLEQTVNHHYAMLKDNHERMHMVMSAITESIRTLSSHVGDVRNTVQHMGTDIKTSLGNAMGVFLNDIRSAIDYALDVVKRRGSR